MNSYCCLTLRNIKRSQHLKCSNAPAGSLFCRGWDKVGQSWLTYTVGLYAVTIINYVRIDYNKLAPTAMKRFYYFNIFRL